MPRLNHRFRDDPAEFFERFFPQQFAQDRHRYRRDDSPGWALFEVIGVGAWGIRRVGDAARRHPRETRRHPGADQRVRRRLHGRVRRAHATRGGVHRRPVRRLTRCLQAPVPRPAGGGGIAGAAATLALHLEHEGATRRLFITPGPLERTAPAHHRSACSSTTSWRLLSGRKGFASLLLLGQAHDPRRRALRQADDCATGRLTPQPAGGAGSGVRRGGAATDGVAVGRGVGRRVGASAGVSIRAGGSHQMSAAPTSSKTTTM